MCLCFLPLSGGGSAGLFFVVLREVHFPAPTLYEIETAFGVAMGTAQKVRIKCAKEVRITTPTFPFYCLLIFIVSPKPANNKNKKTKRERLW